ncbi:MAG: lytic transglycosylase domain-containing protein [Betaproteobacteria bacterium]|nr:lytic transglycosylase domain-containing protein [Betaproteobacteria bacterium]
MIAMTMASGSAPAGPAAAPSISRPPAFGTISTVVTEASRRFGIPVAWLNAVIQAESGGDVHALSPKGAMGLMQIMPYTWADLRTRYHLGANPYSAHDNIMAGAAYLRELLNRFGSAGFLAAYNAGPARWAAHLAAGERLPTQTYAYLARVKPAVRESAVDSVAWLSSSPSSWTAAPLFPSQKFGALADRMAAFRLRGHHWSTVRSMQDWRTLAPSSRGLFAAVSARGLAQ